MSFSANNVKDTLYELQNSYDQYMNLEKRDLREQLAIAINVIDSLLKEFVGLSEKEVIEQIQYTKDLDQLKLNKEPIISICFKDNPFLSKKVINELKELFDTITDKERKQLIYGNWECDQNE